MDNRSINVSDKTINMITNALCDGHDEMTIAAKMKRDGVEWTDTMFGILTAKLLIRDFLPVQYNVHNTECNVSGQSIRYKFKSV